MIRFTLAPQTRIGTPAMRRPATLPRLTLKPTINLGAPAPGNQVPSTTTRAAMEETTATAESSYMLHYLLGGAAVLVVIGALIYRYQRYRDQESGRGGEPPENGDDDDPNSGPSEELTKSPSKDVDANENLDGAPGNESPRTDGVAAGSFEDQVDEQKRSWRPAPRRTRLRPRTRMTRPRRRSSRQGCEILETRKLKNLRMFIYLAC